MIERPLPMQADEVQHRLLRLIEQQPELTQREAAEALGISLGKVNYCIKALVDRGYVKLGNFRRNPSKVRSYGYLLTPSGIEAKTKLTLRFLRRKVREYEQLEHEIATLLAEVGAAGGAGSSGQKRGGQGMLMRAWHLVMTRPRQERMALEQLQRQGFEAWLPMVRESKSKSVDGRAPLFPRYLFVNVDSQVENTSPIRSTIGCCGLVRFGERAATLPEPAAMAIRQRCDESNCVSLEDTLVQGARVKVLQGPFSGFEAIFHARTSSERVAVLLHWLGMSRAVQLPLGAVARLN